MPVKQQQTSFVSVLMLLLQKLRDQLSKIGSTKFWRANERKRDSLCRWHNLLEVAHVAKFEDAKKTALARNPTAKAVSMNPIP